MKFSIATLLANFSDEKLVAPKALEKKLDCQEETNIRKLQIALDALERIGILAKDKGRYRLLERENVVEAKLRCSSKGFCFAIQDSEGTEDVYIRESHLSNAWNGDRVLVKIVKEGSRRRSPEGKVEVILERANPSVLARVKLLNPEGQPQYRAIPLDDRLLFELDLLPTDNLENAVDHLVHVEVVRYPLGSKRPIGKVVQILGSDAEAAEDIDIVCCKHDLPRDFPKNVLEETELLVSKLSKSDLKNKLDLRHKLTLAFGDASKKDINHALSLETIKSGQWRLGIHIADIPYYVESDTPLDKEARQRSLSVYLGEKTIPIFPESISCDCLALLPEQDRLALSIAIVIDKKGQIVEFEIEPSVVRVDYQLSYEEVEVMLQEESDPDESIHPAASVLNPFLQEMLAVSQAVRNARLRRGAFELNLPEQISNYDEEGDLGAIVSHKVSPSRAMVAELTILANQVIASHLQALGVPAIYRLQNSPEPTDVQEFIKLANNMGAQLYLEGPEEVHPADFQTFVEEFSTLKTEKILTYLLEDTIKPAAYSTTTKPHFGLALLHGYTHCTSPLSRYCDLLVLRVLHTVFDLGRDRRSSRAKEGVDLGHSSCHGKINWNVLPPEVQHDLETELTSVVFDLNERENVVRDAEEDLEGLKKTALMKERTGQIFQGLITGVQSYGFFVEIEIPSKEKSNRTVRVEGLVHVSSLKDDWYEYRSRQQTLVGRKNRNQYRLGDRVEVQVKSVDYYRQQIDLVAISGGSIAVDEELSSTPTYRF